MEVTGNYVWIKCQSRLEYLNTSSCLKRLGKQRFILREKTAATRPHFLGPVGGTLASRAGGLRPLWVAFGHLRPPPLCLYVFTSQDPSTLHGPLTHP